MDDLGCNEGSCTCRAGLVGLAITAQHLLVLVIFWSGTCRLGTGGHQPVDTGGCDRDQDIQTDKAGGLYPNAAIGSMVDISLGLELFLLEYEWRRLRVYLLESAADQLSNTSCQDSQVVAHGITDESHQNGSRYQGFPVMCGDDRC